jgi:hypothetical protein
MMETNVSDYPASESFSLYYVTNVTLKIELQEGISDALINSAAIVCFRITIKKYGSVVKMYESSIWRKKKAGFDIYLSDVTDILPLDAGDYTIELTHTTYNNPFLGYNAGFYGYYGKINVSFSEKQQTIAGNAAMQPEMNYKYDKLGNIQEIQSARSNIATTYLWSYNHQYPIAKIENATYAQVKSALGYNDTQVDTLAANANPNVVNIGNSLRTNLPSALVTTYTYKPLVGMLTATDPRGVVTYYEYDAFGRLKETYYYENNDMNKKRKVENYEYHYKN